MLESTRDAGEQETDEKAAARNDRFSVSLNPCSCASAGASSADASAFYQGHYLGEHTCQYKSARTLSKSMCRIKSEFADEKCIKT